MLETLTLVIAAAIPSVVSVIGIITAVLKFVSATKNVGEQIKSTKEYEDIRAEMKLVYKKNAELQERLNELLATYNGDIHDELETLKAEIKSNTKAIRALNAKKL